MRLPRFRRDPGSLIVQADMGQLTASRDFPFSQAVAGGQDIHIFRRRHEGTDALPVKVERRHHFDGNRLLPFHSTLMIVDIG